MENNSSDYYVNTLSPQDAKSLLTSLLDYATDRSKALNDVGDVYDFEWSSLQGKSSLYILKNETPILNFICDSEHECFLQAIKRVFCLGLESVVY